TRRQPALPKLAVRKRRSDRIHTSPISSSIELEAKDAPRAHLCAGRASQRLADTPTLDVAHAAGLRSDAATKVTMEHRSSNTRLTIIQFAIVIWMIAIGAKLLWLQVKQHDWLLKRAAHQQQAEIDL